MITPETICGTITMEAADYLEVYGDRNWIDANSGERKVRFLMHLRGGKPPFRVRAELKYTIDALDIVAFMHGGVYTLEPAADEEISKVEPELEVLFNAPIPFTITREEIPNLQQELEVILDQKPAIVWNERYYAAGDPTIEYEAHWFWRLEEGDIEDERLWGGIFESVIRVLEYLNHRMKEQVTKPSEGSV